MMASFSPATAETIIIMAGSPALNVGPSKASLLLKHRTDSSLFSLRASSSSAKAIIVGSGEKAPPPPPFDSTLMSAMECKIKEQLQAEQVIVRDAYGDGRHVSIEVVSEAFEGQSEVNRQRLVYKAIWEELQSVVHAVDHMEMKTPAEASEHMS